jgi:hypothetical protein
VTILRIGSTPKYSSNFDKAFSAGKKNKSSAKAKKTSSRKKKK